MAVRKQFIFDRKLIDYVLWCKWGEAQLNSLYKSGNSHRNPVRLDMLVAKKIRPNVLSEHYHYNPTLQLDNERIRVYWRVSAYSFVKYQDEIGKWHGTNLEDLEHFERIATGILDSSTESNFGFMMHESVLPEIEIIDRDEALKSIGWGGAEIYVEDPRAHEGTGRYISACARFEKDKKSFYRMLLIDLATYNGIIIPSSDLNRTEKNWVVICELKDSLLFLNQSKPLIIEKVNIKTGFSEKVPIQENESQPNLKDLNGGTPFVKIDAKHFIRVARLQFPIYGIGPCRISVLVLHDSEFKEVARSKPFVFNKLGVEICNGLIVKDNQIFFSWGEDDIAMYVGRCSKDDLMSWFNENLQH